MSFVGNIFSARAAAVAGASILLSPLAHADWTGKGEAGLLISRGNTVSTSANAKLDIAKESGDWKNAAFLGFLYGKNAAFTTAQRVEAKWQTNYKINDRSFWFGALHGEQDKFSGFAYQASLTTGYGYKIIDNEATKLTGTVGAGYRRLRPETLTKSSAGEVLSRVKGDAVGDAIGVAGLDFSHALTKNTKITNKLLIESGSKNTSVANDLALTVSMSDALALSVGYGVRYNTDPPAGAKKSDQLTTINLVYSIK
jgi:putative salt-induced outer membrane protein